jgi:hypothetical protein
MNRELIEKLRSKFFSDPDWVEIEKLILSYIDPLKDMATIDTTQPAEHVKAELIGRMTAYNNLTRFLNDTKIVGRKLEEIKTSFK